jgi:2-amino-4-hydroxy-6-hydroxymethyldihydropteridine diphosphokinase
MAYVIGEKEYKAMPRVYLGLGSNLGNRVTNLTTAVQLLLSTEESMTLRRCSSLYETAPVGYQEQNWFINAVVEVETPLSPRFLLECVLWVEKMMKRERTIKWGPRILDIDILLYDTLVVQEADLQIPHPELVNRAFVLIPLYEIAPHLTLPSGESIYALLQRLPAQGVTYYAPFPTF